MWWWWWVVVCKPILVFSLSLSQAEQHFTKMVVCESFYFVNVIKLKLNPNTTTTKPNITLVGLDTNNLYYHGCMQRKYFILFRPTLSNLNSKREIYSNCRHKQSALLVPKERKSRKKPPGWKGLAEYLFIHLSSCLFCPVVSQPDESESLKLLVA